VVPPAVALEVLDLDLGSDREHNPVLVQLAHFDGPRGAAQMAADRRSDERIVPAVQTLPGYCGAITALATDGGYVVVVFVRSELALTEGQRRILSLELPPGEDPALLTGPDRMALHDVVLSTGPLTELAVGGVR
jgi:hypothetical protein